MMRLTNVHRTGLGGEPRPQGLSRTSGRQMGAPRREGHESLIADIRSRSER